MGWVCDSDFCYDAYNLQVSGGLRQGKVAFGPRIQISGMQLTPAISARIFAAGMYLARDLSEWTYVTAAVNLARPTISDGRGEVVGLWKPELSIEVGGYLLPPSKANTLIKAGFLWNHTTVQFDPLDDSFVSDEYFLILSFGRIL
jgi:hypothetical protein